MIRFLTHASVLFLPPVLPANEAFLPALRPKATIVFIRDSITDGGRARTGNGCNHTMAQDYAFILAAQLRERLAERNLVFINRGVSGDRVIDLEARWKSDVLDLKPDVLSVLVGINDSLGPRGEMIEQFAEIYDRLLRDTLAAFQNPDRARRTVFTAGGKIQGLLRGDVCRGEAT